MNDRLEYIDPMWAAHRPCGVSGLISIRHSARQSISEVFNVCTVNVSLRVVLPCIAGLALTARVARAQDLETSFEFTDTTGQFVLEAGDAQATFNVGLAQRIGVAALYHSGAFAWMIAGGDVGIIEFDPPAAAVDLFLRESTGAPTTLTVLSTCGDVLAEVTARDDDWTLVSVEVAPDQDFIGSVRVANEGASGFGVVDDLSVCFSEAGGTPPADPPADGTRLEDPLPGTIETGEIRIALETLSEGLVSPVRGLAAPGQDGTLFVVDQVGTVWAVELTNGQRRLFADFGSRTVELGVFGSGSFDERGLLGLAFHPDYRTNGRLYTYISVPAAEAADFTTLTNEQSPNHQSVVSEWQVRDPGSAEAVVDVDSEREVLRVDQPQFNHNAGDIVFADDGLLFIALGDGGGADDVDGQVSLGQPMVGHGTQGNGQDPNTVLGAILRIDPLGRDAANGQYGIPVDNPFVGGGGAAEVYAYGFRNPYRMSVDALTGELYAADVGQNDIEEVNVVTAGGNYGWNVREGSFDFDPNGDDDGFVTAATATPDLIDPVAQYDHDEGLAIVGGFVYRGSAIPALSGRYVFGDFARSFSNDGRLFYLADDGTILEFGFGERTGLGLSLLGFGQDAAGELYVCANATGTPFEETGVVLRITAGGCTSSDDCAAGESCDLDSGNCVPDADDPDGGMNPAAPMGCGALPAMMLCTVVCLGVSRRPLRGRGRYRAV